MKVKSIHIAKNATTAKEAINASKLRFLCKGHIKISSTHLSPSPKSMQHLSLQSTGSHCAFVKVKIAIRMQNK